MELRSSIKTPRKYDDLDYHDHNQEEVHQRTPHPEKKMIAYTGPIVEYNPSLRPAVFPTIPLDQEVDEEAWQRSKYSHCQRHAASASGRSTPASLRPSRPFDLSSFNHPQLFASTSPSARRALELNRIINMSPPRTPSPMIRPGSPASNIEMRNKTLVAKFNARTDDDWNIAEMETSDEEEPESRKQALAWDELPIPLRLDLVDKVYQMNKNLEKTIKDLHLNTKQRAEIIDLIAEYNEFTFARDDTLQQVDDKVNNILLNGTQDDKDWLTRRGGYHELMEENVYKHVIKLGYLTSTVSTVGQLRLAKQYLATCGFSPDLLRSWTKPKIGPNSRAIATDRVETLNSTRQATHFPTFSLPRAGFTKQNAQEAAFLSDSRTHNASPSVERSRAHVEAEQRGRPLLRVTDSIRASTPQKRSASGSFEPQANPKRYNRAVAAGPKDKDADSVDPEIRPPIARFPRPKGILKNSNRRHTTNSVPVPKDITSQPAKPTDMEAVAEQMTNNNPDVELSTRVKKLHQRVPASIAPALALKRYMDDIARRREAAMRGQISASDTAKLQASHQKAYVAPALARPFALPPQLSQQQAEWLPDGHMVVNTTHRTSITDRQSDYPRQYDSHGVEIPPSRSSNGVINRNVNNRMNSAMNGNNNNSPHSSPALPNAMLFRGDPRTSSRGAKISYMHANMNGRSSPHSSPALPNAILFDGERRAQPRGVNTSNIQGNMSHNMHSNSSPHSSPALPNAMLFNEQRRPQSRGANTGSIHNNMSGNGSQHSSPALPNAMLFNIDPRLLSQGANTIPNQPATLQNFHNSQNPRQGPNGQPMYGIRQVPNMMPVQASRPRAPPAQMVAPSTNGPQLFRPPSANGVQQSPRLPSANEQRPG